MDYKKMMSKVLSTIFALTILLYFCVNNIGTVDNSCQCQLSIVNLKGLFLFCSVNCPLKPINSRLYNQTCVYMSGITAVECQEVQYIATTPENINHTSYSWILLFSKLYKIFTICIVWLFVSINKYPIMLILNLFHLLVCKIKRISKLCKICNCKYLFSHIDCPKPLYKHRTDIGLVYYILLLISVIIVGVKSNPIDNNVYNYYEHGKYTEIQILDKEHFSQDFKANGYIYNFYITNSHISIEYEHYSIITKPVEHSVTDLSWSCDGPDGCIKQFEKQYNTRPEFIIKKVNDGFSCVSTTATICGKCQSKHTNLAEKVRAIKVSPYIDITVTHGNNTHYIQVRDFNKFYEVPYYIKPIEPVNIETLDYILSGTDVYIGNICVNPGYSCFGPNYIKDNRTILLHQPKVTDPLTHDREFILEYCDYPMTSDLNMLTKTNYISVNNTILKPYDFGLLSIGIPLSGKLIGDLCTKQVEVKSINIDGCYDCEMGIIVQVEYMEISSCGYIHCSIGQRKFEFYADIHSNSLKFHTFYGQKNIKISCNNVVRQFDLKPSNEASIYHKFEFKVVDDGGSLFSLDTIHSFFLFDYKHYLLVVFIILVVIYLATRLIKNVHRHIKKIRQYKEVAYMKKHDVDNQSVYIEQEQILIVGPPDL
ncbi:glycoprotein precursor [Lilac chlorotic ringspot-associated virus]|uniref:Glycoprotein n=1 Tax=Lilac chlorotic ringspot-associated virus TaxID=2719116 RepID=A0A6G8QHI0_9VIRU|nr:glycoprotein precursor [Lilac chlorotic ringspot-associated virus]QIN85946.1 glycoprotein precursor [Lilac chlorotic ringspot-associated virus]